jgi:hypothetical protein
VLQQHLQVELVWPRITIARALRSILDESVREWTLACATHDDLDCVREMVLDVRVKRSQGRWEAMDHPHACFIERANEFSACHLSAYSMVRMKAAIEKS